MTVPPPAARPRAVRIAVISDTHLPRGDRVLPDALLEECAAADLILHAGDVVATPVWAELEAYGRILGVRGNGDEHDLWRRLPQTRTFEIAGTRIGMIHDSGRAEGRAARCAALFPGCDVVVFGHSHVPLVERHGSLLLLNPGSAIDRRRQPTCTMVRLTVEGGVVATELLPLPTASRRR
jgi:hypothetical protein